jgi:hypothetical protein
MQILGSHGAHKQGNSTEDMKTGIWKSNLDTTQHG